VDCERIKDILPDYHLGHLSPDEEAEVRRHIAEHPECLEALSEVAEVMDLIPASVAPLTPPPELKQKVLARIEKEVSLESLPPRERSATRTPARDRLGRRVALLLASALGATVVALAFMTFAYVNLDRENDALRAEVEEIQRESGENGGAGELLILTADGTGLAPDARGTVVADPSDGTMALAVYDLPELPPESGYHAWLIDSEGVPVSLGEMDVDGSGNGRMTGRMEGPANSYDELEITRQPEASETHSGDVVLQTEL
jgi:anti-sigma-K factor RskA